mmetsp:Transcript_16307/g.49887  ORF Transcript_16307/g.49887 Transcript_16307/m.49887 type:complete len:246 (-) Transcript_16307:445-1182(-)
MPMARRVRCPSRAQMSQARRARGGLCPSRETKTRARAPVRPRARPRERASPRVPLHMQSPAARPSRARRTRYTCPRTIRAAAMRSLAWREAVTTACPQLRSPRSAARAPRRLRQALGLRRLGAARQRVRRAGPRHRPTFRRRPAPLVRQDLRMRCGRRDPSDPHHRPWACPPHPRSTLGRASPRPPPRDAPHRPPPTCCPPPSCARSRASAVQCWRHADAVRTGTTRGAHSPPSPRWHPCSPRPT